MELVQSRKIIKMILFKIIHIKIYMIIDIGYFLKIFILLIELLLECYSWKYIIKNKYNLNN
jgi:hypothetical protein